MATLQWATFLANLQTDLQARPNLSGVDIKRNPFDPTDRTHEGIYLIDVKGGHEHHSMGAAGVTAFQDGFDVRGRLWAREPDDTDEPGIASLERAQAMLQELVTVLENVTTSTIYGGVAQDAMLDRYEVVWSQAEDSGWIVHIEFTIGVLAWV